MTDSEVAHLGGQVVALDDLAEYGKHHTVYEIMKHFHFKCGYGTVREYLYMHSIGYVHKDGRGYVRHKHHNTGAGSNERRILALTKKYPQASAKKISKLSHSGLSTVYEVYQRNHISRTALKHQRIKDYLKAHPDASGYEVSHACHVGMNLAYNMKNKLDKSASKPSSHRVRSSKRAKPKKSVKRNSRKAMPISKDWPMIVLNKIKALENTNLVLRLRNLDQFVYYCERPRVVRTKAVSPKVRKEAAMYEDLKRGMHALHEMLN